MPLFGCDNVNEQSNTRTDSVEVAKLQDKLGQTQEMTTFDSMTEEVSEIVLTAAPGANPATKQQIGTSVVTNRTVTKSNTEYAKESTTTLIANNL